MAKKIEGLCIISLVILTCAPAFKLDYDLLSPEVKTYFGSEEVISPYLWVLYKYGLPNHAETVQDLFVYDCPGHFPVWSYGIDTITFVFPAHFSCVSIPPSSPPGDLRISRLDTCRKDGDFCIEFLIDGLATFGRKTLYKTQILITRSEVSVRGKRNRWMYLWDSPPIIGNSGLRAVKITTFIDEDALTRKKNKPSLVLVVLTDFVSGQKREAVFKVEGRR